MKVCLSSSGPKEESLVDARFGRCPYYAIYDTRKKFTIVKNDFVQAARGAGIGAAQKVVDLGCQVVITGNMGPNAFNALKAAGVKIVTGAWGKKVKEAFAAYQNNELEVMEVPRGRGGFRRGGEICSRGFGRGRGRS